MFSFPKNSNFLSEQYFGVMRRILLLLAIIVVIRGLIPVLLFNYGNLLIISEEKKNENLGSWIDNIFNIGISLGGTNRIQRSQAFLYWILGDTEEALASFTQYLNNFPKDETALLIFGELHYQTGNFSKAEKLLSNLPASVYYSIRARESLNEDNRTEALFYLELARITDPYSNGSQYFLAQVYRELISSYYKDGEQREIHSICIAGEDLYRKLISQQPGFAFLYIEFGSMLRDCGKNELAIEQFSQIDEKFENIHRAWSLIEIGLTYNKMRLLYNALLVFQESVDLYPQQEGYRFLLAEQYQKLQMDDEARAQYLLLLQSSDNNIREKAQKALSRLEK
jgi:tetratricopeptide (TPR) repeat protein